MTGLGGGVARRERPLGVVIIALFLLADAGVTIGQVVFDTTLSSV